jgi:tetratricopeptide (TPR) repeat protein
MSESPRIEELRRRVQGDPASIAFAALAEEFRRAGRFKEAVETSRAGLRHHPTYVSARVTLGRSLVELQEFEQAERELAFVLRSAPDNLAARRALGELCWQRLRFADALSHFKAAQVLAPRDAELPGIISSLERELESERGAAAATAATSTVEAEASDAALAVAAAVVAAEPEPAGVGKPVSGAAAIAALEKFYRAIVRARDAKPPAAPHISGV